MLRRSFLGLLAFTPFAAVSSARAIVPVITGGADVLADRVTFGAYPAGSRLPIFWAEIVSPESVRAALVDEVARFERLGLLTLPPAQAEVA